MKTPKDSSVLLLTLLFILALVFIVLFMCVRADAMPIWGTDATSELVGSRSTGNGIVATGGWIDGFKLSWKITEDPNTHLWTYNYIVAVAQTPTGGVKNLSNLIIEVTEGQNFSWTEASPGLDADSPQEYAYSYTNPDITASLYGIKFEGFDTGKEEGGLWLYESSITTLHAPVYGMFAAKDGVYGEIETCAWNIGLNPIENGGLTVTDFVVRPNGIPAPEPATCLLVGFGLLGLIGMRKKKRG